MEGESKEQIHFLVMVHDAADRLSVVDQLRSMGYSKMNLSTEGQDALQLLKLEPSLNFVIYDDEIPGMDGLSVLKKLRRDPSTVGIPFLLLLRKDTDDFAKQEFAKEAQLDGFLPKPVQKQQLKDKIESILTVLSLGQNKEIIVVDDDAGARETVVDYLKEIGFKKISSFENGNEAFEYILKSPSNVGLIVSDWEMPGMSGITFLQECKNGQLTCDIPFIIATSQTPAERTKLMQAVKSQVNHYILKPFKIREFRIRVTEAIGYAEAYANARRSLAEGAAQLEAGHYKEAFAAFERAAKVQPKSEAALSGMAEAAIRTDGNAAGIPHLVKAIEAHPSLLRNYIKLTRIYEEMNHWGEAIQLLEAATRHIAFNSELHFSLGKLYLKASQFSEAQTQFEMVLEINKDHEEAKQALDSISILNPKGKERDKT